MQYLWQSAGTAPRDGDRLTRYNGAPLYRVSLSPSREALIEFDTAQSHGSNGTPTLPLFYPQDL